MFSWCSYNLWSGRERAIRTRRSLNGAGGAPIFRGIMPARGGGLRVLDARDTGMKKERRLGTCGERLSRTDDDICQTYTQRTHILGYGS